MEGASACACGPKARPPFLWKRFLGRLYSKKSFYFLKLHRYHRLKSISYRSAEIYSRKIWRGSKWILLFQFNLRFESNHLSVIRNLSKCKLVYPQCKPFKLQAWNAFLLFITVVKLSFSYICKRSSQKVLKVLVDCRKKINW